MLTQAESRTLHFIEDFFSQHQKAPKLNEIAFGIGIKSKGTVSRYINTLVLAGHLTKQRGRHRGLQLNTQVPKPGISAAHDTVAIVGPSAQFSQFQQCHGMRIKDDILAAQGVFAGDTLLYHPASAAKVGDVIMAYLDKKTPMIKRVTALPGEFISLACPHTEQAKPKAFAKSRLQVYGVVKGIVRAY